MHKKKPFRRKFMCTSSIYRVAHSSFHHIGHFIIIFYIDICGHILIKRIAITN